MNKSELRKYYLNVRKNIVDTDFKSRIIVEQILNHSKYKNSKVIGLYSSYLNEVNLNKLVNESLLNNKIVAFPIVVDEFNMIFSKITSLDELKYMNKYKIKEPIIIKKNIINPESLELILVPGVCFDYHKNRIGYGKGYYDRYLEKCNNSYNIGICFDEQLIKRIYIENNLYDKSLDEIITDKRKIK